MGFLNIRSADHDSIPLTKTQYVQSSCDSLVPVTIPLHVYRQAIQQVYCGVLWVYVESLIIILGIFVEDGKKVS